MTYQSKKHKEVFDKAMVKKNAVDFDAVKLNAIYPKGYTLYCAAKDIYFAPEDEIETHMENMMYQGQKVTVKNIGIDSPEYCLKIDEQEITMQTDGEQFSAFIDKDSVERVK